METGLRSPTAVIPAKAGTQYAAAVRLYRKSLRLLGSRFRGNDAEQ